MSILRSELNRARFILIAALLIMLSIFGALGYWVVGRARDEAQTFSRVALERLALGGEINAYLAEGYARVLLLLITDTPSERAALRAEIEEFRLKNNTALKRYAAMLTTEESRRRLEDLTAKRERYRQIREQVIALDDQGKRDEALKLARASLWPAYVEYTRAGDVTFDDDVASAKEHADHIQRVCSISQILAALVAAFGFIGGITLPLMLVWLGRGLTDEAPLHP